MEKDQIQFVKILKAAIHGEKVEFELDEDIDWDEILIDGKEHNVLPLIYYSILNTKSAKGIDKKKFNECKVNVFKSNVNQINHIQQLEEVFKEFNYSNIRFIVLKGLVIRQLYPVPESRTMSDADIIVKKVDLQRVSRILISMGYEEVKSEKEHGAHIVFQRGFSRIEVHWTLLNKDYFEDSCKYEDSIWDNLCAIYIGNEKVFSLSWEDLAVHLCIHMATHFSYKGFGIRQLCDFVLLVEKKGRYINWVSFNKKIQSCKIEKFVKAVFNVCKILFDMKIPIEIEKDYEVDKKTCYLLINDIFAAGVFGSRDKTKEFGRELAFDKSMSKGSGRFRIIKRFIRILFPSVKEMCSKYDYVKKYKVLLPVAWIQHLIVGIKNENYDNKTKFIIMFSSISVSNKRRKLLKKLDV